MNSRILSTLLGFVFIPTLAHAGSGALEKNFNASVNVDVSKIGSDYQSYPQGVNANYTFNATYALSVTPDLEKNAHLAQTPSAVSGYTCDILGPLQNTNSEEGYQRPCLSGHDEFEGYRVVAPSAPSAAKLTIELSDAKVGAKNPIFTGCDSIFTRLPVQRQASNPANVDVVEEVNCHVIETEASTQGPKNFASFKTADGGDVTVAITARLTATVTYHYVNSTLVGAETVFKNVDYSSWSVLRNNYALYPEVPLN